MFVCDALLYWVYQPSSPLERGETQIFGMCVLVGYMHCVEGKMVCLTFLPHSLGQIQGLSLAQGQNYNVCNYKVSFCCKN